MSSAILHRARTPLALAITTILSANAAYADDSSPSHKELETMHVEGVSTTIGRTVIDAEELDHLNPNDLQDVFRNTPSVQIGSSLPASQKLYVNGIEETNLSITIDGARQNNKLFHHSGTNIIDPELLKAVNVDSGVAPADAGPGALGGSVAFETKDVTDLLEEGDNFGGSVGLEFSTNGDTFDRSLTLYGRSGGFEALGFFKKATGNDFEDGHNEEVIGSEAKLKSGLFKIGYLHDSGYRAKLSLEQVEDDGKRPERANFNRGFTSEKNALERETITFSVKDETPEGLFNPYIKVARTDTDLEWNISYPTKGKYESVNGVIANEFVLDMGSVNAGVDFYDDSTEGIFPTFNQFPEEKSKNIGAFAQARLTLNNRTRVSFGARYDDHEIEGVDGSKHDNEGTSTNLSGEFDITEFVMISAGYSHIFGGVQLAEPYIINTAWDYSAGLKESKADNWFVAFDLNAAGLSPSLSGLTVGVKFFDTDIDDIRDEEFRGGPDIYSEVESDGFEINSQYDWQSGFARFSYIDVDTEINGIQGATGSYYIGTPLGKVLKADMTQSFADLGITVGADVQHYFAMDGFDTSTNTSVDNAFEEYTVANAYVSYIPSIYKDLTLRATLNNVFDEDYTDRASYGQEFGDVALHEPGRSLQLSAKLKF